MTHSDQLRFIASAILPTHPEYAVMLESIAIGVRRLERFADEAIEQAIEDEQLRCQGGNVVRLDRFRRVPISDGRTA